MSQPPAIMDGAPVVARQPDALPKPNIGFAWAHSGRELVVVTLGKAVPTGLPSSSSIQATPACIIPAGGSSGSSSSSSSSEPLKMATSGWTTRPGAQTLDNEKWTALVRQFAAAVGFRLHWSIRDTPGATERVPANDGRYLACHAEKKLGLFFLSLQVRHYGISLGEALQGKLREANLPLEHRRAEIYLGHKPCKNCLDFLKLIRRRTGIDVHTSTGRVFSEHKRKRSFYQGVPRSPEPESAEPVAVVTDAMAALMGENDDDDDDDDNEQAHADDQAQQQHEYSSSDNDDDDDDVDHDHEDEEIIESVEQDDNLDALDEVIATLPTGNVRRQPETSADSSSHTKNARIKKEARDKLAMPPPPATTKKHMSVHSSPSPPLSLSLSMADSVIRADRRLRYGTYSSPSRCSSSGGGDNVNVTPPSAWGDRGKPPVTACLEAPDEAWGVLSSDGSRVNGQSYFWGTPSVASSQDVQEVGPATAPARAPPATATAPPPAPAPVPASTTTAITPTESMPRRPPYIPPYLRRLQNTARTTENPQQPTPVVDLTDDDDAAAPAGSWHPPMRAVDHQVQAPRGRRRGGRGRGIVPTRGASRFPNLSSYRYSLH